MSRKIAGLAAAVAVGLFAYSAKAMCPNCSKHADAKVTTVGDKAGEPKAPCGGQAHSEKPGGCDKPCCAKKFTTVAAPAGAEEKVESVLAALPKMMYRVGEEMTCCSKSAAGLAEKTGKPIQYVVGEETMADETQAKAKLTALLEKELENMRSMQFTAAGKGMACPATAKQVAEDAKTTMGYRVAGLDFADKQKAEEALKLVAGTVDGVKMTYKVDGQSFCCDKMAGAKAKETGKPIVFVIGEEETPCEKTANLLLTQAKIQAIVAAAAALAL